MAIHKPEALCASIRFWAAALAHTTALIVIVSVAAAPALAQPVPTVPEDKWSPWIDFEGKAGTKRNLGEADVFMPVWQDGVSMVFGDVRTRLDDHESREGNFGAGFRHMTDWGWNLGTYGYFDRRRSDNLNYYNQVTVGAEALSVNWDLRGNAYIPEGRRQHDVNSLNTATLSGTSVIFRDGEEKSLRGFDAELGWRVPLFNEEALQQLRIYAGGYTFYADSIDNRVQGPRGRIEFTAEEVPHLWQGSRLTLDTEVQNDGPRGTQAFFAARLRVPLQFWGTPKVADLTPMERRMTDRIVRDVDIVSQAGTFGATETATQLGNGNSFTVFNSATTTGAALPGAVAAAGSNVILSGTFNTTALTQVQSGQNLMAGPITVRSASGRTATLTTSATISSTNANAIQLAGNNTLSGLTINTTFSGGAGGSGVLLNNTAGNISILNNTITVTQTGANAAVGINASTNTNVTISGNTVTLTGSGGATTLTALGISSVTGTGALVTGNTISASGGTTNRAATVSASTITSGSTGNVKSAGVCNNGGGNTGQISFSDGSTCP
jgi:Inverse autotransporter, beta-domain